jgi:hypothetical protein
MSTPTEENPNEPRATESDERRLRLISDLARLEALIGRLEREHVNRRPNLIPGGALPHQECY